MTRRDFFRNSAVALFGFSILPGAGRVWHAKRDVRIIPNKAYKDAQYEMLFAEVPFTTLEYRRFYCSIVTNNGEYRSLDPYPLRFNKPVNIADHDEIRRESIPPFIVWKG